jgi:hypothetical protein
MAIEAGLAPKLMLDWYDGDDGKIYIIAPASDGCEGELAPEMDDDEPFYIRFIIPWNKGRCVLLSDQRLCTIHDSGFKPHQCRLSFSCDTRIDYNVEESSYGNKVVSDQWNTDIGRAVVVEWKIAVNFAEESE